MTNAANSFISYSLSSGQEKVIIADGTKATVAGKGSIKLTDHFFLSSALHVPSVSINLLSVSSITKQLHCSVTFFPDHCVFQDLETKQTIGTGREVGGLYYYQLETTSALKSAAKCLGTKHQEILLWHSRLGHLSFQSLKILFPSLFFSVSLQSFQCEICQLSKHCRTHFSESIKKSLSPFDLVHSDVWGPSPVTSLDGYRYFLSFIDDYTHCTWLYLMKTRDEVPRLIQNFCRMVETQFNSKVKILRSDNAREYFAQSLNTFLEDSGILHESSCPYTPQQNGVAERKNRHILETARALLFQRHLPKYFWADAVLAAAYLINQLPSKGLENRCPLTILHPSVELFSLTPRVFGSLCFIHVLGPKSSKLDPRSIRGVFIGYSTCQKGYKCFDPITRTRYILKDVTFFESESYYFPQSRP